MRKSLERKLAKNFYTNKKINYDFFYIVLGFYLFEVRCAKFS